MELQPSQVTAKETSTSVQIRSFSTFRNKVCLSMCPGIDLCIYRPMTKILKQTTNQQEMMSWMNQYPSVLQKVAGQHLLSSNISKIFRHAMLVFNFLLCIKRTSDMGPILCIIPWGSHVKQYKMYLRCH